MFRMSTGILAVMLFAMASLVLQFLMNHEHNPNTFTGKEEGREGWEKKRVQHARGAWDLLRARRGPLAAGHGSCSDK